jgi:NAD(P)-dependent dehydrogenase (short-subunit alcohol dehydrogenase family)
MMQRGGYGRIVNVTSIAGQVARANDVLYPATKGGLDALTRAMAADLGRQGITVNAIAPGYFATEPNQAMVADKPWQSGCATARHWAAGASRKKWRARWCSWPRRRRPTSRAGAGRRRGYLGHF